MDAISTNQTAISNDLRKLPAMKNYIILLSIVALFGSPSEAWANGAPFDAHRMGGIEFKHNEYISIEKEVLQISSTKVRVSYTFHSAAKDPITVDIAFPAARGMTEGPDVVGSLDFEVIVDGKRVATNRKILNFSDQQNIASILEAAGGPVPTDVEALLSIPLSEKARQALKEASIPFACDENDRCWFEEEVQELFTWRQTFPPGITHVDVSYTPWTGDCIGGGLGSPLDFLDRKVYYFTDRVFDETWRGFFCIDKSVEGFLKKLQADPVDEEGSPRRHSSHVIYTLSTANYWKGPIKEFHLIIDKESPQDIVSYCPAVGKKTSPTRFEWHAKDFVPWGELRVLFLTERNPWDYGSEGED